MTTILLTILVLSLLILAVKFDTHQSRLRELRINSLKQPDWYILVPQSFINRRVGLLNTPALAVRHGLLIKGRSVHMKGMLFSLDLVALDRTGQITAIASRIAPGAPVPPFPKSTTQVLELAAGQSAALALKPGDHLSFGDPL